MTSRKVLRLELEVGREAFILDLKISFQKVTERALLHYTILFPRKCFLSFPAENLKSFLKEKLCLSVSLLHPKHIFVFKIRLKRDSSLNEMVSVRSFLFAPQQRSRIFQKKLIREKKPLESVCLNKKIYKD